MNSPTLNGLSKNIIMPPKKLDSKSFAARPTINPPTPPNASKPDMLRPISCIIIKAVITTTNIFKILTTIS